jgi:hypothetical protein
MSDPYRLGIPTVLSESFALIVMASRKNPFEVQYQLVVSIPGLGELNWLTRIRVSFRTLYRSRSQARGHARADDGMSCYSVAEEIIPGRADFLVELRGFELRCIFLIRSSSSGQGEYERRDGWLVELEMFALPPEQELRDAIDLIVVSAVWEGQKLRQELPEPRRVLGKMDVTRLDFRRLGGHAFELAALGANAHRTELSRRGRTSEVLKEIHAGTQSSMSTLPQACSRASAITLRRSSGYSSRPWKTSSRSTRQVVQTE